MKMAKASEDDFQKTIEFLQFIDEWMEYGTCTEKSDGDDDDDHEPVKLTEEQFVERLRKMWGGRFRPPGVDCSWSRVVHGAKVLIDNVCDPDADTLEWKPELRAKLQAEKE